jgi:pentapeptide repeat protein
MLVIRAAIAVGIMLLASASAGALTTADLLCPVAKGWTEGSDECPCQYRWKPTAEQLETIRLGHRRWAEQKGWQNETVAGRAMLCNADLRSTDLRDATLAYANLAGANLQRANLSRSNLEGADLRRADLSSADLSGVNLTGADLQRADLRDANLQRASLVETNLEDAQLALSDLTRATYAPRGTPGGYVTGIRGLSTILVPFTALTRRSEISGLIHLRQLLEQSGFRDDEREVTFAIEYWKTRHAWDLRGGNFLGAVEAGLRIVLFDWTTSYGLVPFRAIRILIALIVLFALAAYVPALLQGGRIYRVWPSGRLETSAAGEIIAHETKIDNLQPRNFLVTIGYALQFSLLSAFQIGWRELNVGSWLARLTRFEYALTAVGWPRTVAGIQSLISVYLLAIWALTYFGRPFQ